MYVHAAQVHTAAWERCRVSSTLFTRDRSLTNSGSMLASRMSQNSFSLQPFAILGLCQVWLHHVFSFSFFNIYSWYFNLDPIVRLDSPKRCGNKIKNYSNFPGRMYYPLLISVKSDSLWDCAQEALRTWGLYEQRAFLGLKIPSVDLFSFSFKDVIINTV